MQKDQSQLFQNSHHDYSSSPTIYVFKHHNRAANPSNGNHSNGQSGGRGGARIHRGGGKGGRFYMGHG